MLDLSAAFDTIDHEIFVNRLCHTFHIKGRAQDWFASYLQNRKSCVCLAGEFSAEHVMSFGLPQGSILGPRGYLMYTHPIGDILRRYNVCFTYTPMTRRYTLLLIHVFLVNMNTLSKDSGCAYGRSNHG